jgi:hypothetical protein
MIRHRTHPPTSGTFTQYYLSPSNEHSAIFSTYKPTYTYLTPHHITHHAKMSKQAGKFFKDLKGVKNVASKFTPSAKEGSRILPSRSKDASAQFRIDAGHFDPATKKLNVVLQINSQAKSPALVEWARKHSTHDKLATESFDTAAKDHDEELDRVFGSMEGQAKKKLG